ncbi:MAG: hypothetical protein IK092_06875, partial [Muribaculaceae bacterium]|nr:hypothetical protein [Muribaculaceae bacterium]
DAANAGYKPEIAPDGKTVIYREKTFDKNHLSYITLHSRDLTSGKENKLVKKSRNLQGYTFDGNMALAVNDSKLKSKAIGKKNAITRPVLSISNRHLMITCDGKTTQFDPNGDQLSYLWPSLSPDGTKVLYYVATQGTYVCNIDGTGIKALGELRAPKWLDNNTVIGMNDVDDGMFITASSIVISDLNGVQQTLTPEGIIAMYPQPAQNKIAFSTADDELYIINFTK